jgi:hypothetical protein
MPSLETCCLAGSACALLQHDLIAVPNEVLAADSSLGTTIRVKSLHDATVKCVIRMELVVIRAACPLELVMVDVA